MSMLRRLPSGEDLLAAGDHLRMAALGLLTNHRSKIRHLAQEAEVIRVWIVEDVDHNVDYKLLKLADDIRLQRRLLRAADERLGQALDLIDPPE